MSEQTAQNLRATVQFKAVQTPSGKKAFEAYAAVWDNDGKNVVICAPTLDALENFWAQIAHGVLNRAMAQHVWIVKAE